MNRDEALEQLKYIFSRPKNRWYVLQKTGNINHLRLKWGIGSTPRYDLIGKVPCQRGCIPSYQHAIMGLSKLRQVGPLAFGLQLLDMARIHPVFHASQLKLVVGMHNIEKDLLEELQGNFPVHVPIPVLDKRTTQQQGDKVQQVLIEWKGDPEATTWEDMATMTD